MRLWLWLGLGIGMGMAWGAGREEVSLNGTWEMVKVSSLEAPPPREGWQPFQVPGTVNGYNYERAWFRRKFPVPSAWRGRRLLLHFGGVKYNSRVLVNGRPVGGCFNGYDAFEVDATEAIRFGAENELLVGVHDWTGLFSPGEPVDFSGARDWDSLRALPRDRILGPIGGLFTLYGLWDDVSLKAVPPVFLRDLFVRPSVRRRRLEVEVTLVNASHEPFAGPVHGRLFPSQGSSRDAQGQWPAIGKPVATFPPAFVQVAPGQSRRLTLTLENPPLELWWPHRPCLYILEVGLEGPQADVLRERIGFREFWVQGGDFFLNGVKVHLLATSWWPAGRPPEREAIAAQLKAIRAMNAVCFRTHTQPWPKRWYELADEVGLLMIPEGAVWNDDTVYRVNDPRFWENYAAHLRAMVRHLRNHPSIVLWSLENEFYGPRANDNTPQVEANLARMGLIVKEEDPTRPITYESDGDPGGVADVIGLHYPNEYPERRLWPNEAFWMEEPRLIHGGGGMFWDGQPFLWKREKPLYIGEYLWVPSRDPGPHTLFFGDEAYRDYATYRTRGKALAWRMQILAYRHYEVSGHSPWTVIEQGPLEESNPCWVAQRDMYRPLAAFLREFDSRFFAGERVERTVEIFNDTMADLPRVPLRWVLLEGSKEVATGEEALNLPSGAHREVSLRLPMPQTTMRRRLTLRLSLWVGKGERFREEWPLEVWPRPAKWQLPKVPLFLYDPQGRLRKVWERDGAAFHSLARLQDWPGQGVLIIGPEALAGKGRREGIPLIGGEPGPERWLAQQVSKGGRVLVLEQSDAASPWLPVPLSQQSSTMTFPLMPSHPLWGPEGSREGFGEWFRWWRGDHLVSHHEPLRPVRGGMRALVVSGTAQGLSHAPLLEIPQGQGLWLLCQLQVVSKLEREPVARWLLERMVNYLASQEALVSPSGETWCLASPSVQEQLTRLGVDWRPLPDWEGLRWPEVGLLILQADGATLVKNAPRLRAFLEAGGRVLWHRPRLEDFEAARKALGIPVEMQPYRGPALRAEGRGPWLEALTREDLYWLERPEDPGWSPTPLAADMAEAIFLPRMERLQGILLRAEEVAQLEGAIVRREGEEILFATVGRAHWEVNLPQGGDYLLGLWARGTPLEGVYPLAEVFLDGERIGILSIGSQERRLYSLPFSAQAGRHRLTVAFTNDRASATEDRNLFVAQLILAPTRGEGPMEVLSLPAALVRLPTGRGHLFLCSICWDEPGRNARKAQRFLLSLLTALGARFAGLGTASVVEAEEMAPQSGLAWFRREADHVYLGTNGFIEGQVRVLRAGRYRITVWGRGTPAEGEYPLVALELDGKELGRVEIRSDDWGPHLLRAELPAGEHLLRLRFLNDLWRPPEDRNLWLDRLEFEEESER